MDNQEEQHEPKIPLPEAIFVGMFVALADAFELMLLFFALDDFWISDAIAFPATQIYFRMRGVKGTASLATNVLELFPYIGSLPLRTIGFVMTVWMANHPAAVGALGAVAKGAGGAGPKLAPAAAPGAPGGASGQTQGRQERGERRPAAETAQPQRGEPFPAAQESAAAPQAPETAPRILEEDFGVKKEPLEKVRDIMETIPAPEPFQERREAA